jgi:hypothetical protein
VLQKFIMSPPRIFAELGSRQQVFVFLTPKISWGEFAAGKEGQSP